LSCWCNYHGPRCLLCCRCILAGPSEAAQMLRLWRTFSTKALSFFQVGPRSTGGGSGGAGGASGGGSGGASGGGSGSGSGSAGSSSGDRARAGGGDRRQPRKNLKSCIQRLEMAHGVGGCAQVREYELYSDHYHSLHQLLPPPPPATASVTAHRNSSGEPPMPPLPHAMGSRGGAQPASGQRSRRQPVTF
jgi:hypothetical protein